MKYPSLVLRDAYTCSGVSRPSESVFIYGLKKWFGPFFYVGQTVRPSTRAREHWRNFGRGTRCVPLALAKNAKEAVELEKAWIRVLGAPINKKRPIKAPRGKGRKFWLVRSNRLFYSSSEVARFVGCTSATVNSWARDGGEFTLYNSCNGRSYIFQEV